eukprot:jgi/Astpho2/31/fgenesh1_pg.00001_%23_15_t
MSNPWASVKPAGAWSDQVEEAEASGSLAGAPDEAFPDLSTAATIKDSRKEKKKKQTMSLADFQAGPKASYKPPSASSRARTAKTDDDIVLPTAPKPRDDDDDGRGPGLGGAFARDGRDYSQRVGGSRRDDDEEGGPHDDGPSRADQADNWGKDRKFVAGQGGDKERGFGGGNFRDRNFDDAERSGGGAEEEDTGPSRADQSDNWGRDRRPQEPDNRDRGRSRGFEDRPRMGGFRDRDSSGDRGFEPVGPSRADEEDRWSRKFAPAASRSPPRAQHVSDTADRWMRSGPAPSQASTAEQPAFERKRLQLKPRSLPAPELPTPPEPKPDELKTERQPQAAPAAPKPRSNPFGQARPREEVLKEKGVSESGSDRVDREETAEEMRLKERIAAAKKRVEAGEGDELASAGTVKGEQPEGASTDASEEQMLARQEPMSYAARAKAATQTVQEALADYEKDLVKLSAELDKKAKLSTKAESSAAAASPSRQVEEGPAAPIPEPTNAWRRRA